MCDGYSGYNKVPDAKRTACWAHIRRYLTDAIPKGKQLDYTQPSVQGMMYINQLFHLEDVIKAKYSSFDAIKKARLEKEKPIVEGFLSWLDKQNPVRGSRIYRDKVLPEEPYEWESAIHIYKEYAIKLGLFRKKVGDCIEIGQNKYEITEIMPIECFLVRKCMTKMIECGLAKSFCMDQNLDNTQNKFIEWIQENIKSQKEFDWLEYYKDFRQMPITLYSLYKCTKLTYEQFVLAMLKEKSVVIRNMLNEDCENENRGYRKYAHWL